MTAPHTQCQPDIEAPRRTPPTVANLRRASQAVYLACDEKTVADDISDLFKWAADRIEYLEATEANQIAALKSRVEELTKALETVKGMFGPSKCFSGCKCWRCQMNFTIDRALAPSLEGRGGAT